MEVLAEVQRLDQGKPPGLDELSSFLFKRAVPISVGPSTNIFNIRLCTAEIPHACKSDVVHSLFKGGDQSDPNCTDLYPFFLVLQRL